MIKRMFFGSNTPYGFIGYYKNVSAKKTVILKGGPGTGKSTLMKKCGDYAQNKNLDVDYMFCSSDPDSLDGIYIPALDSFIIDGTSPHALEPELPVLKERIINLAEQANEQRLLTYEKEISERIKIKKQCFNNAYSYLNAVLCTNRVIDSYYLNRVNSSKINKISTDILNEIKHEKQKSSRVFFTSAITPKGIIDYSSDYYADKKICVIYSASKAVSLKIVALIEAELNRQNRHYTAIKCPLSPYDSEHIIIGDTLITCDQNAAPDKSYQISLNPANFAQEIEISQKLMNLAIHELQSAREQHLAVEKHYIAAMDFGDINKKTLNIINDIFHSV